RSTELPEAVRRPRRIDDEETRVSAGRAGHTDGNADGDRLRRPPPARRGCNGNQRVGHRAVHEWTRELLAINPPMHRRDLRMGFGTIWCEVRKEIPCGVTGEWA